MKETFREKIAERIYGGIGGQIKYLKQELKDAKHFIKEDNAIIGAFKKKYPKTWKKHVGGYIFDLKYHKNMEKDAIKSLSRWQRIQKAKRLGKVI